MSAEIDNKVCPFCGEEIKAVAIKCKHCNSLLTNNKHATQMEKKTEILLLLLYVLGMAMLFIIFVYVRDMFEGALFIILIIISYLLYFLMTIIPAAISTAKGNNFIVWYIYGFLLGIIAMVHAVLLPPKNSTEKVGVKINNTKAGFIIAGIIILSLLAVVAVFLINHEVDKQKEREARIAIQKEIEANETVEAEAAVEENTYVTISWNGGTYEGEFKNGKPHGQGEWSLTNGSRLVGEWENGKIRYGQAIMVANDGTTYYGTVEEGEIEVYKSTRPSNDESKSTESSVSTTQTPTPTPTTQGATFYLGTWKNIKNQYTEFDMIDTLVIKQGSGGHYLFDMKFTDGSGMESPATYNDGYFTIQMPGYTWAAHYDSATGYLVVNYEKFRKVN